MSEPSPHDRGAIERGTLSNARRSKPFDLLDFLWRRTPLILGLGIPAFLLLNLLTAPFVTPIYKVEGSLLIKQSKEPTIGGRDRETIQGDVGYFQRTLGIRVLDRDVLRAALAKVPEDKRPAFLRGLGDSDRAVFRLMSRIVAKEVERTYLIRVSMDGDSAEGLAEILHAVLQSLIEKLQHEQERQFQSRLDYLRGEREKIAARGEEEKTRILELASMFENRSFLRAAYTADLSKLEIIQKLYWEAEAVAAGKESALKEAQRNQREIVKLSLEPFAQERLADNFGLNQIERWTYEQSQQLRSSIDGLTPDNPDRKYVEARMQSMNDYMARYKESVAKSTISNLVEKRAFDLDSAVINAQSASVAAQESAQQLKAELDRASEEASRVSEGIFKASERTFSLGQLRDRLASINTRIDDTELEAKSPLPVTIDQEPTPPVKPASTNASKLRLASLVLSFGLIAGLCVAFDFLDGRIRTRRDLGAAIGGAGAEPIPATVPEGEDPAFARILGAEPRSAASVALRDLALRLALERERSAGHVFSILGVHARAGATTIALNVARALSAHGLRVLVAELPTASPGLAAAAGLPAGAEPPSPWGNKVRDPESGVDLIPWIPSLPEDRVRATLDSFLKHAATGYDIVLLDLASIAQSDITQQAALKSDAIVLVVRQDVGTFEQVRAAVERIAAGGVPAVTVALNFHRGNPMRVTLLELLATGQRRVSDLHRRFLERVGLAADAALAKWKARRGPATPPPKSSEDSDA